MSWKEAELAVLVTFIVAAIIYMVSVDTMKSAPKDTLFLIDSHGCHQLEAGSYISGYIDGKIRHMSVYGLLKIGERI